MDGLVSSNTKRIIVEIDFDKLFKVMVFSMRMNRSHPDIKRDKKWALQFILMHGIFFITFCILVYSIINYDLRNNDFAQACANGVLCVVFCVVTFMYCIMLYYQDLLRDMIEIMKRDYKLSTELPLEERNIVLQYAYKGKRVVNLWLWISIFTASLFPLKSVLLMTYYAAKGNFKLVHLYELRYPVVIEEVKNEPAPYAGLYLVFLFFDMYAMFMYIAFAPLGPVFMLHVCGHIELVKKRILTIFPRKDFESEKALNKLKDVVIHLQKIYSFVENIKKSFKVVYELTLKATMIILPITFHQIIQSLHTDQYRLEFIPIIIGGTTLSGIPCYYSDLLMETGKSMRLAVFSCGWEIYWDRRIRSMLLVMLSRAARPVAVRTMFRTLCLDALTDLFQQSYAIFNVMNAVWN